MSTPKPICFESRPPSESPFRITPCVQERVLEPTGNRLQEAVITFSLGLTLEQQSMLHFWAKKLASDDELDHIFAAITRKAGWKP